MTRVAQILLRQAIRDTAQPEPTLRPMGSLASNLTNLLLRMFDAGELRRFLGYLPDGRAIVLALPGPTSSFASIATEAVTYLQRHGLINRDLRDALVAARPRRVGDIERVFSAAGI